MKYLKGRTAISLRQRIWTFFQKGSRLLERTARLLERAARLCGCLQYIGGENWDVCNKHQSTRTNLMLELLG